MFGETVTAVELTPEGTGYRAKTRFAKFNNLPELMAMFKQVADIKTADMLDLPVPEVEYHNIAVKPSQVQKEMVASLGERAEKIRGGNVDSSVDNMLKVTNDGRKLALDQRMMNPMLPDEEGSKVNACVNEVFRIWEENSDKKLTQLLFCDLSTPKGAGEFSVYTDIRQKLIERGIPESEIKFIHEADTEAKKQELFKKVRRGEVRILMGSTQKMGAGTNVQNKIIASHDLDCPWRPADLEQRAGRTVRQGNENPKVGLYRYVTEGTFDAYCWQLVEGKQIFINRFGNPQHQGTLNKAIRRIIRDCNDEQFLKNENPEVLLPHFSCHSLRHTFTTRMCEAGVNVKVIQDTLGHKDISTTLNIYTDVTKELRQSEAE